MKLGVLVVAALVLAGPAAAAERQVLFGDAFRLETDDPGPFQRLADGRLVCLSEECAGRTVSLGGVSIRVVGRVTPEQVKAAKPPYRAPTTVPDAPGRSIAPLLVFLLAALFGLVAAALLVPGLLPRHGEPPVDALRRALRLVRESAGRRPGDRRRALDHLAATLGDAPPAGRAMRLAWSRPEPEPEATLAVAEEVVP
jgi:hypothetical protein